MVLIVLASVLSSGGESSQPAEKSSDAVPATVTNSYQVEAQLRLVVEVVYRSTII